MGKKYFSANESDYKSYIYLNPLHITGLHCFTAATEYLLSLGFNINEIDPSFKRNIFLYAILSKEVNINFLKYLVLKGVNFHILDKSDNNAILLLLKNRINMEILIYLVELNININQVNKDGQNAFTLAV